MHRPQAETKFLRLKWRRAFDRWGGKAALLVIAAKGGFDPNQPRVPAGNPDGGQWTGGGSGSGSRARRRRDSDEGRVLSDAAPDNLQKPGTRLAQARGPRVGSTIRFGGRTFTLTPRQSGEYAGLKLRADTTLNRVRQIDPTWKPRPSAAPPQTAQGVIETLRGNVREAELRLSELARQSPTQLIDTYRTLNNSRDLFGREIWPRERDTVAITKVDQVPFVGINSRAPTYTVRDRREADIARDALIAKYPDAMNTTNIGMRPNNALYHAEATILLRTARAFGGSLAGRKLEIRLDRRMCTDCERVIHLLSREIGSPTVTFVNPNGVRKIIRNGEWLD